MAHKNGKPRSSFEIEISVLRQCKRLLDTIPVDARGRVLAYLLQSSPDQPAPKDPRQDDLPFGAS